VCLYKLDVLRRVGCVALSHWVGSYEAQYSKAPEFRDPSATVRVFSTDRNLEDLRKLYERILRVKFVDVPNRSAPAFRLKRGATAALPFSYVSLIEIEQKGNAAPKVLIVCGDVFRVFW